MPRLWVVLTVVVFSAGCVAPGTGTPSTDGALSFSDAEKVHGVALARRYVEEQGMAPGQATYRLDERISSADAAGSQKKSRQMFVVVEFEDREPWRLLVLPDGTLRRVEATEAQTTEASPPS
ncbi:MAG TPA: hypothetical protein VMV69_28185 [Pirellulales bacterium]|nr:hypothetical protein [Pirellulales bacterium]